MKFLHKLLLTFFSKTFILFVLFGLANTVIHIFFYSIFNNIVYHVISNAIAFTIASLFSYFVNTYITYKKEYSRKTFILAIITFTVKLLFSSILEWVFFTVLTKYRLDQSIINVITPILITIIITPLQFVVFNKIFSKSFFLNAVKDKGVSYDNIQS